MEIIDNTVQYGLTYLRDIYSLAVAPKRFLQGVNQISKKNRSRAVAFIVISIMIVSAITPTFVYPTGGYSDVVMKMALKIILQVLVLGICVYYSWRIVKVKLELERVFITACYIIGILTIIGMFFSASSIGALYLDNRPLAEEYYGSLIKNPSMLFRARDSIFFGSYSFSQLATYGHLLFAVLGMIFTLYWSVITWGAFSAMAEVTRLKSFFVFLINYIATSVLSLLTIPFVLQLT